MNLDPTTPQIDAAGQKATLVPWDLNSTLPKKKIFANTTLRVYNITSLCIIAMHVGN